MSEANPTRSTPFTGRNVKVHGGVLVAKQQPSGLNIRRSTDYYEQHMLKCPGVCAFHSLAELYHACLLEGDPEVEAYVPQPFNLRINGKRYIPDIYYRKGGREYVGELKPRGEFDESMRIPLEQFFQFHGMTFIVISNESVLEREVEAQNWLSIVQNLAAREYIDTTNPEWDVYEAVVDAGKMPVSDFVDIGDRDATEFEETAIYRLLYQGRLIAHMDQPWFGNDSVLQPCM